LEVGKNIQGLIKKIYQWREFFLFFQNSEWGAEVWIGWVVYVWANRKNPVMTFSMKKIINTELFIDEMTALSKGWTQRSNLTNENASKGTGVLWFGYHDTSLPTTILSNQGRQPYKFANQFASSPNQTKPNLTWPNQPPPQLWAHWTTNLWLNLNWANLHWAKWYWRTCIGRKIIDPFDWDNKHNLCRTVMAKITIISKNSVWMAIYLEISLKVNVIKQSKTE